MKTKDINNIIIGILSIVLFLAPLLVFPRELIYDYNIPKVIVLYTCGIILSLMLIIKRKEIKYDKKDIFIFIFLLLAGISLIFSINKTKSLFGETGRHEGFFMIIVYILVYYFAKYYFSEYKHFYKILFGIVIGISILSILQFYDLVPLQKELGLQYRKYWTSGTFGNPNFLASYVTIFLPIVMCLFVIKGKKRYLIMSIILFWSMLCTLTRSSWLAFGIYSVIGIIYVVYKREKLLIKNSIIILMSFIIIFGIGDILSNGRIVGRNRVMINEFKSMYSEGVKEEMGSGRIGIWKVTLNVIKNRPLTGGGIDSLKDAIALEQYDYYIDRIKRTHTYVDKAHNEYLQIAATMGIPALIVYLLFLFFIFKDNIKNIFKDKLTLILLLSIIGYLIQAFFNISTIGVAPVFWMLLGLIQNNQFKKETIAKLN